MNSTSVYKSILSVFFITISITLLAGQPIFYKMGKYYFKKNKYDLSLWFMNQSRNKISKEIRPEYYDILFEIFLKKPKKSIKESAYNFSYANRYLKRAHKYNRYSQLEYNQKSKELYDSSFCAMIELIKSGSKTRLVKYFQSHNDELSQFLTSSYNLETSNYNNEQIGLYTYRLKKLLDGYNNKHEELSEQTENQLDQLLEKQFSRLFKSRYYSVLKNFMDSKIGVLSFKKNIADKSNYFQKILSDTLSTIPLREMDLARDFYYKVYIIDPSMVKENHTKNAFIQYHYANLYEVGDLDVKLSSLKSIDEIPFYGDSIELTVPHGEYFIKKVFPLKDNLWAELLLTRSVDAFESGNVVNIKREINNWNTVLNYDSSFYKNQIKRICFDNFETVCEVIPELLSRKPWDTYHNKDYSGFIELVDEIYEDKIRLDVSSNKFESASKKLVALSYINPAKKRSHHLVWLLPHFKNLLELDMTKSMSNEMVLANHVFSKNKKIIQLRKQYLEKDYILSHKPSALTADDVNWTGDISECRSGSLSQKYYDNMLERLKFFRRMIGVSDDVIFTEKYNQQAQDAALIMNANSLLHHHPKKTYSCYSESGYKGASHGNLYAGRWSSDCIDGYINDSGVKGVGHRRWIFHPFNTHFGTGSTLGKTSYGSVYGYNCLVVITDEGNLNSKNFYKTHPITWPTSGYFPTEFIHNCPWSFSLVGADFSKVKVIVKQNGVNKKVVKEPLKNGYGSNTISWIIKSELNTTKPIEVALIDVYTSDGDRMNYEYEVIPFSIETETQYTNN